ncbi:MAG: glycoside hydrolase family 25 protein [Oscillospiraceae bacterium]|nr:glycoside hydrolase family 25 protein [Oscillospiraceae bacterium]
MSNLFKKLALAFTLSAMLFAAVLPASAADDSFSKSSSTSSAAVSSSQEAKMTESTVSSASSTASQQAETVPSQKAAASSTAPVPKAETFAATASIKGDTDYNFSVYEGREYTFRFEVIGPRGLSPTFSISTAAFKNTSIKQTVENGHDVYYYKIKAVGSAGLTTDIYTQLPGQQKVKRCTVTIKPASIKGDTDYNFSMYQNSEYTFRFEVVGPRGLNPAFSISSAAFQNTSTKQTVENGRDVYYYKIKAVGSEEQQADISTQLPGQQKVKRCTVTIKPASIKGDTDYNFSMYQNSEYTFRFEVVGPRGLNPAFSISSAAFQSTSTKQTVENGRDVYYYKIKAVGSEEQQADISTQLPGQQKVKRCTVTIKPASIKGDTDYNFSMYQNSEYTFRFEVVGPRGLNPAFSISSAAFQNTSTKQTVENGRDVYYYKIKAVGSEEQQADISTQLPGQQKVKRCTVTIKPASIKGDTDYNFSVYEGREYTFRFEVIGPRGLSPTFSISTAAFKNTSIKQTVENGHDVYYYKIKAVGSAGLTTDIYTQLPEQQKVKRCKVAIIQNSTAVYLKGIDVSEHNGIVDWEKAKADGLQFAILRCGYGSDTTSHDDKQFERNISECERLGIRWGTYLYSYALTVDDAQSELAHVLRLLNGKKPDFPVFIDMEDADYYREKNGMPSNETLTQITKTVCAGVKNAGYLSGYYVNKDWYENYIIPSELSDYLLWYARPGLTAPDKTCSIWQSEFPETGGAWDGADVSSGGCALDVSYADFSTWRKI